MGIEYVFTLKQTMKDYEHHFITVYLIIYLIVYLIGKDAPLLDEMDTS